MSRCAEPLSCFNCRRSEMELPLVAVRFATKHVPVCTQCMPVIIHNPERVAERLRQVEANDSSGRRP